MGKSLHSFVFLSGLSLSVLVASSQNSPDHSVYAVTDIQKQGSNWSFLRKLDFQTGQYSTVLLNGDDTKQLAYDANTKKQVEEYSVMAKSGFLMQPAFSSGVAAIAFDKKNNRLYYTPMFIDQLRYIDLSTMKVYYVTDKPLTGMPDKSSDQGNVVTRMTIGSDGNIYAMTNDAAHLLKITTGNSTTIQDLGSLVDDPKNKNISVHNSCSSFGGDMIADNEGNLYVITARNNVFKINIESKIASYEGVIKGLPITFTTNGAAVDDNNQLILGSAADSLSSYFVVNPKTWTAKSFTISGDSWRSSDLATSNLLNMKQSSFIEPLASDESDKIQVYPNPVSDNQFTIQFSKLEPGNYSMQITDVMGRAVLQKSINIKGEEQSENVKLNPADAKGVYLIKVASRNNSKSVLLKKIVVQ